MRVLICGKSRSGSWRIRGEQLGAAIGATVTLKPTLEECQAHDLIVVVKRAPDETLDLIRRSGKPWVLDVVDCYPQPMVNCWTRTETLQWARNHLRSLKPSAVVWPNLKMSQDVEWKGPAKVLYHHGRPNQGVNPIREKIAVIGYEGGAGYLSGWAKYFEDLCAARGWEFVINPKALTDVDIVVAFRGKGHNGYASRSWKSNVKLANAHITGTPIICAEESAYIETASGAEYFASNPEQIEQAIAWLEPQQNRHAVSARLLRAAKPIASIAKEYKAWLEALRF